MAIAYVAVDNFVPSDFRTRLEFTPFELDSRLTLKLLFFSAFKWKHVLYFFFIYSQLKKIWNKSEVRIAIFCFALAVLVELEQAFVSGREARIADLVPDMVGYVLARWYFKTRASRAKQNLD
jgi:VanZ family protein